MLLPSVALCGTAAAQSCEQPNILMIVCEDISSFLGCYGDSVAYSPNLDRFANQAIRHTNMYTCVGVSSPSRYSLITGRYASNDGANFMRVNHFEKDYEAVPPAGVKCYTEYLRAAGYYCTNNNKTDYQFNAPIAAWDEQGVKAHWRNADSEQPFFAVFNLNVTHESQIWKRSEMPLVVDPSDVILPPYYPDTPTVRHDVAVMYSNIAAMDEEFQELLDELEASERADNTIVIFYSDNGGPLPRGKREILDSGSRVPFMIRLLGGQNAGSVSDDLNMFVDIPATVLSLAGVDIPENIHGQAIYGDQAAKKGREYVFGATDRFDEQIEKRGSIRNHRYQYIYNYMAEQSTYRPVKYRLQMPMMAQMVQMHQQGLLDTAQSIWFEAPTSAEELYDCEKDPHQINNLAADKSHRSQLKKMRKAYKKEWIEAYNKEWSTWAESDFIEQRLVEGKKPQVEPINFEIEEGAVRITNDPTIYSISYRINRGGKNLTKNYNLYQGAIQLDKGDTMSIIMERIGHLSREEKITY